MARSYSYKFLLGLKDADPTRLGVKLGRLCVEANLPATYVARALNISRMTIYAWFRGQGIREEKRKVVEAFMTIVETDMEARRLPAASMIDAKLYIEEMVGGQI
jgi:hypothetical protein